MVLTFINIIDKIISNDLFIKVFIPILCAILGGLITYFGVKKTIEQNKVDNEEKRRLGNKPYINVKQRGPKLDDYSTIIVNSYVGNNYSVIGFLKNTDNGIFRIQKIVINLKDECKPIYSRYIEKNETVKLIIYLSKEDFKNYDQIIMIVKDVFENEYEYLLEVSKLDETRYQINGIIELEEEFNKINIELDE